MEIFIDHKLKFINISIDNDRPGLNSKPFFLIFEENYFRRDIVNGERLTTTPSFVHPKTTFEIVKND